jgi:hypothetical protein
LPAGRLTLDVGKVRSPHSPPADREARTLQLLAELQRRIVIRMAGLYLVGAWLIIQIAETLMPAFEVPNWVLRAIIILLAIGFIPAPVFRWYSS